MDSTRRNLGGQFDTVAGSQREYKRALDYTNLVMAPGSDPKFHQYRQQRRMPGATAQAMTEEQIRYNQAERWRHKAFDAVRHLVKEYHWSVLQQKNKDDLAGATKAFAEALVQAFMLGQNTRYG